MNCCGPYDCAPGFRRFESRAEKRERLSAYAVQLEHELTAVKERLEALQAA